MNFTNKLLIATNKHTTDEFKHTVIYLHYDDMDSVLGMIINCPLSSNQKEMWVKTAGINDISQMRYGGMVELNKAFILHTNDIVYENSAQISDDLIYTGASNIIDDINSGMGPKRYWFVAGGLTWTHEQLEDEINDGYWTVIDYDLNYFFKDLSKEEYWEYVIKYSANKRVKDILNDI